jgi:hypothetical protein
LQQYSQLNGAAGRRAGHIPTPVAQYLLHLQQQPAEQMENLLPCHLQLATCNLPLATCNLPLASQTFRNNPNGRVYLFSTHNQRRAKADNVFTGIDN